LCRRLCVADVESSARAAGWVPDHTRQDRRLSPVFAKQFLPCREATMECAGWTALSKGLSILQRKRPREAG